MKFDGALLAAVAGCGEDPRTVRPNRPGVPAGRSRLTVEGRAGTGDVTVRPVVGHPEQHALRVDLVKPRGERRRSVAGCDQQLDSELIGALRELHEFAHFVAADGCERGRDERE